MGCSGPALCLYTAEMHCTFAQCKLTEENTNRILPLESQPPSSLLCVSKEIPRSTQQRKMGRRLRGGAAPLSLIPAAEPVVLSCKQDRIFPFTLNTGTAHSVLKTKTSNAGQVNASLFFRLMFPIKYGVCRLCNSIGNGG